MSTIQRYGRTKNGDRLSPVCKNRRNRAATGGLLGSAILWTCGCVTHWAAVDRGADRMGVDARLMAPETLAAARVRHSDNASL